MDFKFVLDVFSNAWCESALCFENGLQNGKENVSTLLLQCGERKATSWVMDLHNVHILISM